MGNRLTDQAWQQQVAEEGDQRSHTWSDEVTQSRRLKVCFTCEEQQHSFYEGLSVT